MSKIFFDLRGILGFPPSPKVRMAGMPRTILEWAIALSDASEITYIAPGFNHLIGRILDSDDRFNPLSRKFQRNPEPDWTERIAVKLPPSLDRRTITAKVRRRAALQWLNHRFPLDTRCYIQSLDQRQPAIFFQPTVRAVPTGLPHQVIPVMNVYDLIPLVFKDKGRIGNPVYRRAIESVQAAGGHYIVNSAHVRHSLICMFDVDPGKVHLVQLGVSPADVSPAQKFQSDTFPYFLHISGDCQRRKNVEGTIRSFVEFSRRSDHPHELRIVGPSERELQPLIVRFGGEFQDRIRGLGHVSDQELDTLIRNAACGLYLSLFEGFGLPPLEFMTRSVPVICANVTSIPESVGNGGLLVDPFDEGKIASAMQMITTNPRIARQVIELGLERAALLTWRHSGETLKTVLDTILDRAAVGK